MVSTDEVLSNFGHTALRYFCRQFFVFLLCFSTLVIYEITFICAIITYHLTAASKDINSEVFGNVVKSGGMFHFVQVI